MRLQAVVVADDVVILGSGTATGTFASPNVANGITVNSTGFTISGTDAGNYTLTNPTTTANITPASLTVTASHVSGTYGTSAVNTLNGATGFSASGLLGGQAIGTVTLTTNATRSTGGNYNANTGSNPASWTITESAATGVYFNSNYYSIAYDTCSQTINLAALTFSGVSGTNKVYNGGTNDTIGGTASLNGVVSGDTVALNTAGRCCIVRGSERGHRQGSVLHRTTAPSAVRTLATTT